MELGQHIGKNPIPTKKNPFKKIEPKLRRAFPEDITVGNVIIYPATETSEEFTKFIVEVLRPSDDWKAFCAEDGCRYGLDGAYIIEHEDLYLYKISQTINNDWDHIPYGIVCARDEDEASRVHPRKGIYHDGTIWKYSNEQVANYAERDWCHPINVKVELIGIAEYYIEIGVI